VAPAKQAKALTVGTHADLARVYRVSRDTVKSWGQQGMPGKSGKYDLEEVSKWLSEKGLGPWRNESNQEFDDPLLEGSGDSPGLERCRLAKAGIYELELEEKRNSLFSKDQVRNVLGRWADIIRRMAERVAKRHGPEAANAINDALSECDFFVSNEFGSNTSESVASE
jgi:phage terminase Nu1 subunit (DNA packaging protein)